MINIIWFAMMFIGLVVAAATGKIDAVSEVIFSSAEQAVAVAFSMISVMTFWLGIMKIIEKSGLIHWVVKILRPLSVLLFPRLPQNHPAVHAILMNMRSASDEMSTFLAGKTSSITPLPTTVIALRAASGSQNPTEIVGTTIMATLVAWTTGIIAERLLRNFSRAGRR